MALFERGARSAKMSEQKRLDEERKAALEAASRVVDQAAAAVARLTQERAKAVKLDTAAQADVDAVAVRLARVDVDAVAAVARGEEPADLAGLYAERDQAAHKKRATGTHLSQTDDTLQAARDELDDAREAHKLALRADGCARLAKALAPAAAIDAELLEEWVPILRHRGVDCKRLNDSRAVRERHTGHC